VVVVVLEFGFEEFEEFEGTHVEVGQFGIASVQERIAASQVVVVPEQAASVEEVCPDLYDGSVFEAAVPPPLLDFHFYSSKTCTQNKPTRPEAHQ
jgi:hypothetical protein